jgi:hypothetical protein
LSFYYLIYAFNVSHLTSVCDFFPLSAFSSSFINHPSITAGSIITIINTRGKIEHSKQSKAMAESGRPWVV